MAAEVERVWAREAVLRQVTRPAPVLVRWSSTGRPAAGRDVVLDEPAGSDWQQLPLAGDLAEIVDKFRSLPHRQLLVLGEPGAGKSVLAILLTLGLVRRPEPGQPVPLLLPINVWDPDQSVDDFVTGQMAEQYADVLSRHGDPEPVARELVRQRRVLPILDGLDELPAGRHPQALDVLDRFAAQDRPLVVTCRGREYEQAVTRGQTLLCRAAVVEIEPVTIDAAIEFLSYPQLARPRWQLVFDHLHTHPDGPLGKALSTPLMVALARTAYQDAATQPAELLVLPTRTAVAARLMDAFVTSVCTTPPDVLSDTARPRRDCPPERAGRWLKCLAYHLYLAGTRDLRWWQIPADLLAPRPARARRTGPLALTAAAAAFAAGGGYRCGGMLGAVLAAGSTSGLIGATAAGWFRRLWPSGYPPYLFFGFRTRRRRRVEDLAVRTVYGIGCGLLVGLLTAPPASTTLAVVVAAAVVCALVTARTPPRGLARRATQATPTATLRHNRSNATTAAAYSAVVTSIVFTIATWPVATTGRTVATATVAAALFAAMACLGAGGWTWIRFRLTHARLARHGWLPCRLQAFCDDAHQRGVLRQAGAVYQFRHALLQDHLATTIHPQHLRALADAGDKSAGERLVDLLAQQGHVDELRTRADAGDWSARWRLADLLAQQGHVDEAIAIWRARADAGDWSARWRLADLLAGEGRP